MKLNSAFLLHSTGDETILVPTGAASFSGIVRGNKTLGVVLEHLQKEMTEDEIVNAMKKRFDAPDETIRADVQKVISELRKIGAVDD